MLARASRTSAAVENCWRTPPIAFDVAPAATRPRSARTTSRAPSDTRWYATEAPVAPAPATTILGIRPPARGRCLEGEWGNREVPPSELRGGRGDQSAALCSACLEKKGARGGNLVSPTRPSRRRGRLRLRRFEPRVQLALLVVAKPAQRCADVLAHGDSAAAEDVLRRGLEREPVHRRTKGADVAVPVANERDHTLREHRAKPGDRADRAALDALQHELLRPDEDVEPLEQVRLDRVEGLVGDLQSREVRRLLAQAL